MCQCGFDINVDALDMDGEALINEFGLRSFNRDEECDTRQSAAQRVKIHDIFKIVEYQYNMNKKKQNINREMIRITFTWQIIAIIRYICNI